MADDPDLALVRRFKAGDETAFNEIVRRYQEKLYSVALGMVGDHDDAADLSQDAFVKAYRGLPKFREGSALYTWLYRVVVNLSINHLRARGVRNAISLDSLVEALASKDRAPDEALEDKDLDEAIRKAVQRLPAQQKAVFVLRQYEQMSHEEIAQTLGRSVGAVKANYFHAVKKLQAWLATHKDF